jgi:3-methylcrotonyl-CoA carboxylase alpha subunit
VILDFTGAVSPDDSRGQVVARRDGLHVFDEGANHAFTVIDPYLPPERVVDAHGGLVAPMPGRVIAVLVATGECVKAGTPLLVMEAMKMEHTVTAPCAGVVTALHHGAGDQVREGDELLTLAPDGKSDALDERR